MSHSAQTTAAASRRDASSILSTIISPPPTPDTPPGLPATGRAGRNLPAAVGVAVVLIGLVLASLLFYKVAFVGVAALAVCGALWELAGALARKNIALPLPPLWVGTIGVLVSAWALGPEAMLGAYAATAGAAFLWCFLEQAEAEAGTELEHTHARIERSWVTDEHRRSRSRTAAAAVFAATYLPFLAGFSILLLSQANGVGKVLLLIALPVANDTGGWLAGITFGKHPMAPSVSPKKSWEGFAGSILAAAAGGAWGVSMLGGSWWQGVILGVLTVIVSTLGDLGESLLKRDIGLNDMGPLLPGHGGLMDRLDSILVAAPVIYLFSLIALR